ncbi:MAG: phage replication initiation protein [Bacilli bacterium]|nr:phage replication initiation protein [Bacilli bacterium]
MANKRMFTMKIVDSDAFLEMPLSTQCLYFHLNMRADDDGFIGNPKRICKLIGCNDDDLKLLIAKRFVLVFDNGVIVIKHWRMHNTIQKDRYTPTTYSDELKQLGIKDNKSYTLSPMETKCIQNVSTDIDIDIDIDKDIDINKDIENKIIYLLSSSKNIYINLKLVKEYEDTLMMMIKAAQVTKKIPTQGRLEDLMKEMIFDRQDVSNKQGYLIECFKHEG